MYSVLRKATVAILFANLLSFGSANAADIFWVTEDREPTADWDIGWTDMLTANGYNVTRNNDMGELDQAKIDAMNASDLVIISRAVNSGNYVDDDEVQQWNAVTAPMISMTAFNVRASRWKWLDNSSVTSGNDTISVVDPSHPIYDGISNSVIAELVSAPNDVLISNLDTADPGNGTLLATFADGSVAGVLWNTGDEYYAGAGEFAGSPRLYLPFGQANASGFTDEWGAFNATAEGQQIVLNAVKFMSVPEPTSIVLFGIGFLGLLSIGRRK